MSARHVCIIPARAGSKSIPNKNLIKLPDNRGETLVRIAINSAMQSGIFSHVLLTTDIPKQKIYLDDVRHGANAMTKFEYLKRPGNLCMEKSLMIDVVQHAINYLGNAYEYVWLTQATSPIREKKDFEFIKRSIESGEFGCVISFKPKKEHHERSYTITKSEESGSFIAHPCKYSSYDNKQDLKATWERSGNFYVTTRELIKEHNRLENQPICCYPMTRAKGSNVDDSEDLALLKYHLNHGTVKI